MNNTGFVLPTLLLLAACAKSASDAEVKPVASVSTLVVAAGSADQTVSAYGAAEFSPDAERSLIAPVESNLVRILAPPGSRVTAGQAIVVLGPTPASALELGKAQSDAAAADAAAARALRLRGAGLASDAEVETARTAAQTADAAARSLKSRSGAALVLRAPMAGVVETLSLEAGGVAVQGAAVAKIGALTGLRVRLGVEQGQAARIRPGLTVRLTQLSAQLSGGIPRDGLVTAVDPRLDAQTRLAAVYVQAPAGAFAPGEPVQGLIILGQHRGVVLIPRAAVIYDGEQPYVFTVKAAAGHRRNLTLGMETGDQVEVTVGLAAGERIVVDGAAALEDGMAIREATAAKPGGDDGK